MYLGGKVKGQYRLRSPLHGESDAIDAPARHRDRASFEYHGIGYPEGNFKETLLAAAVKVFSSAGFSRKG